MNRTILLLLVSSCGYAQTNLKEISSDMIAKSVMLDSYTTQCQTNGHGLMLACKRSDSAHWNILQPDSLMEYYRAEQDAAEVKYSLLVDQYNALVNRIRRWQKDIERINKGKP